MRSEKLKESDIDHWGPIEARILYMAFWFPSMARSARTKWGVMWPRVVGVYSRDYCTFYWQASEMHELGERALRDVLLPDASRNELWNIYDAYIADTRTWTEGIIGDPRNETEFSRLREHAKELAERVIESWDYGIIPELANYAAPRYLEGVIAPYVPARFRHEVLEALLAPERMSYHLESEHAFLLAVLEPDGRKRLSLIEAFARNYYFVENSYYESKIISLETILERARSIRKDDARRKIAEIASFCEKTRARKAEVRKRFSLPDAVGADADKLAFSIWWQDHRKALSWKLSGIVDVFSRAAVRELGISHDDVMHYLADEWVSLFAGKLVPKKTITERKNYMVVDIRPYEGAWEVLYGKRAHALEKEFGGATELQGEELCGTPVSRGKITGTVKVLRSSREADTMNEGSVLVAPMTSPDYIIAMRKATAIITDVGGLMSHAAIVSRELGIPCIVGTKIATQVLKDGDFVEVNATEGRVRIIKRSSA